MLLVKTPRLLKWLYPGLTWNESTAEKCIYLTFDDGPIPIVTPWVLKTLKKFEAKATFFCIGDNVRKHPDIFEQIKTEGHVIGNHTFHHINGWEKSTEKYWEEFLLCDEWVKSDLFRPPYGRITRAQIRRLKQERPDLKIIMWDVLSHDYLQNLKAENCLQSVLKNTSNGAIVVFHDSLKAWGRLEYVLPQALEYWTKKGYQFKTW
jgi:peptidoglycan/xylan/chitin deacetylase (PgdA/CDA1 family)